jgi:hypothetical protein
MGSFYALWAVKVAQDMAVQIITGNAQGTSLSLGTREGMLYHMWFPTEIFAVAVLAFLAQLELAKHVTASGVVLLAQLAAFVAACGSVFVLASAVVALFQYRAKLRRLRQG